MTRLHSRPPLRQLNEHYCWIRGTDEPLFRPFLLEAFVTIKQVEAKAREYGKCKRALDDEGPTLVLLRWLHSFVRHRLLHVVFA